ncbi:MAG: hypothetical protein ACREDX_08635, partial [Aestuariivirga sp.]
MTNNELTGTPLPSMNLPDEGLIRESVHPHGFPCLVMAGHRPGHLLCATEKTMPGSSPGMTR